MQYSDSQSVKVILHLWFLENVGRIPCVVQYNMSLQLICFMPNSLYLLIHYTYHATPLFPATQWSPLICSQYLQVFFFFVTFTRLFYFLDSICK